MIKLVFQDYDSTYFKRNVWKLLVGENDHLSVTDLDDVFTNEKIDSMYCFAGYNIENSKTLSQFGFTLISIRQTFHLDFTKSFETQVLDKKIMIRVNKDPKEISEKVKKEFAKTIYKTSRYYKDVMLRNDSLEYYTTWVKNSFLRNDVMSLVAYEGKTEVGLLLIKTDGDIPQIDLIGVLADWQHTGVGTALINQAIHELSQEEYTSMDVITEAENVSAVRFYEKNDFCLQRTELIYHKHINL